MAKATKDEPQQLSLSAGSRSLLKQLKPKSQGLPDEQNLRDSSARDEHVSHPRRRFNALLPLPLSHAVISRSGIYRL